MRSLYLRIWLTVVLALALFAAVSGWLLQRHLDEQRRLAEAAAQERIAAWVQLLQRDLPDAGLPPDELAEALRDWARRVRLPLALEDEQGRRIAATESFQRLERRRNGEPAPTWTVALEDGRTLRVARFAPRRHGRDAAEELEGRESRRDGREARDERPGTSSAVAALPTPEGAVRVRRHEADAAMPPASPPWWRPAWVSAPGLPDGVGLVLLLGLLFVAVAVGAYPVVRRLTRRLEALKHGVEAFGAGRLNQRVAEEGRDEVAALGASFNRAAARIESLLRSHQSLLANASHELRSPLARLKMAVALLDESPPETRTRLRREIETNIAELDALVEEVLLSSRLDAATGSADRFEPVPLLALAAEEAARTDAAVQGEDVVLPGDERLLRRALRNLLENARRYGGDEVRLSVRSRPGGGAELQVADRGPGVPETYRERIFEPFFRLPGHAEREGGVGLGLSLVRQIAERHGGTVRCEPRAGGGSVFVLSLPGANPASAPMGALSAQQ
jgi:signal transduction histidine kinase